MLCLSLVYKYWWKTSDKEFHKHIAFGIARNIIDIIVYLHVFGFSCLHTFLLLHKIVCVSFICCLHFILYSFFFSFLNRVSLTTTSSLKCIHFFAKNKSSENTPAAVQVIWKHIEEHISQSLECLSIVSLLSLKMVLLSCALPVVMVMKMKTPANRTITSNLVLTELRSFFR